MTEVMKRLHKISPTKIILLGYLVIILIGTGLLCLPFAVKDGQAITGFSDALFTATSATCVTGLIRFDTYTHWSMFGQIVILALIQIGGIGFMTLAINVVSMTKMKIGLTTRVIMQNSISAPSMGGIVKMTRFIVFGTFAVEGSAAALLAVHYMPRLGFWKGLWFSIFHSISAFCNAGFDLMGNTERFSSLTSLRGNWYVNLIIMTLIVVGGLGFFVWKDILSRKNVKLYRLQTKLVLTTTFALLVGGAVMIFLTEMRNPEFLAMTGSEKVLSVMFQSVTARTAGFNTMDIGKMTQAGKLAMIVLMFIGGSTGSTAGGIKTTTFAVFALSIWAVLKQKRSIEAYGRKIEDSVVRNAVCIFAMYMAAALLGTMVISGIEGIDILDSLFECVSAIGTVGLTTGITTGLGMVSKIILTCLMFVGRVGSITLLVAMHAEKGTLASKLPTEKVQVG